MKTDNLTYFTSREEEKTGFPNMKTEEVKDLLGYFWVK